MNKLAALTVFIAALTVASPAWACPPVGDSPALLVIVAGFLAVPYALLTSIVTMSQARQWFRTHQIAGWFLTSLGGYLIAWLGVVATGASIDAIAAGTLSSNTSTALLFTTPLVLEVAYMMWLHTRRPQGPSEATTGS